MSNSCNIFTHFAISFQLFLEPFEVPVSSSNGRLLDFEDRDVSLQKRKVKRQNMMLLIAYLHHFEKFATINKTKPTFINSKHNEQYCENKNQYLYH